MKKMLMYIDINIYDFNIIKDKNYNNLEIIIILVTSYRNMKFTNDMIINNNLIRDELILFLEQKNVIKCYSRMGTDYSDFIIAKNIIEDINYINPNNLLIMCSYDTKFIFNIIEKNNIIMSNYYNKKVINERSSIVHL